MSRPAVNQLNGSADGIGHDHVFLGPGHESNERKTWAVIVLCAVMMVVEIVGGSVFGSLALIADGLHMSTHAGAMLIAALAYTYARRHAQDDRFVFGTGKMGDLAGFTSAIVLAMISLLIGYEAVVRILNPVAIQFRDAIPIAVVGLGVNIVSAWLLSGSEHHGHDHPHDHDHADDDHDGDPHAAGHPDNPDNNDHDHDRDAHAAGHLDGPDNNDHDHDHDHDHVRANDHGHSHDRNDRHEPAPATHRDNSIRSAYVHVIADAFVSVLAIIGLVLARAYGWLWMDAVAGIVGALVIANWSYGLLRDTGCILLDVCPDGVARDTLRKTIEEGGDRVADLHLWRLGPGHLAAVVSVITSRPRDPAYYRDLLSRFKALSHVTVEVTKSPPSP